MSQAGASSSPVSPVAAAVLGRCPACGKGALYRGLLGVAPACPSCKLDFGFIDAGDGASVFVILIVGFIVTGGALLVEAFYQPPYWLHAILWLPLIILLPLLLLRPVKGLLIGLQFRNKAEEGRLDR